MQESVEFSGNFINDLALSRSLSFPLARTRVNSTRSRISRVTRAAAAASHSARVRIIRSGVARASVAARDSRRPGGREINLDIYTPAATARRLRAAIKAGFPGAAARKKFRARSAGRQVRERGASVYTGENRCVRGEVPRWTRRMLC